MLTDIAGVLDESEALRKTRSLVRERFDLPSRSSVGESRKRLRVAKESSALRQRCVAQEGSGERGTEKRDDAVG
ncbi:MAG: hypothetical protein JW940_00115 [Polyangiaceae bacterium]|nr:hypothetical protein [Polyangiaceae bacterium]